MMPAAVDILNALTNIASFLLSLPSDPIRVHQLFSAPHIPIAGPRN